MVRIGRWLALSFAVLICACDTSSGGPPGYFPGPGASVSPTPLPSPSPTPTPFPATPIILTPPVVAASGSGASNARTVSINESGYTGTFSVDPVPCAGIATSALSPDSSTLTVTPVAPGHCTLVVRDTIGNAATLPVTVAP